MRRKFITNLAFLVFVNLLVKPFWIFGIDRTVQNVVGAEDYGLYFAIFNFSFLLHILLDFGVTNYNNRSVAQDSGHIQLFLSSTLVLKLILATVYAVVTIGSAVLLNYEAFELHLLLFLILNQALLSAILYFRSNISGMHLFKLDSLLSVLDRVLMIVICGALLLGVFTNGDFQIEWFVYAQTVSLFATAIVAFGAVMVKAPTISFQWDWTRVRSLLKSTYPYALLGLLMTLYFRVDAVMIERMLPDGDYEAGVYAASFRLLDAANNFGLLFAVILLPMFARMLKQNEDVGKLVSLSFKIVMVGAISLALIGYTYQEEIIGVLYREANEYWSTIFGLLMFAFIGTVTVFIYGTLLTANGSLRVLNLIALGGMLLNVVLNLFLIPEQKAMGATIATVVTQLIVAGIHILVAQRIIGLPVNLGLAARLILFTLALFAVLFFLPGLSLAWEINLVLAILASIVLAFMLQLFEVKKMLNLLKTKAEGTAS